MGELFCGPGGMALGAFSAKFGLNGLNYSFIHEWACDNDLDSCNTYKNNLCPNSENSVMNIDVSKLNIKKLSNIDILAFGFPCNDFSIVGEAKGLDGNFGLLYKYGLQVIAEKKPKAFVAENVSGIASANDSKAWSKILGEMESLKPKYDLYVSQYHFEKYGVPQTRHRYIIVGLRSDLKLNYSIPEPTTPNKFKSSKEALTKPPIRDDAPNHEFTKHLPHVIERLKSIPPGKNAWHPEVPEHLKLNVKNLKLSNIYRRLHPERPAYTVTGSGGGGTHGYHYAEPRALTNRENARIQTFPDDFVFSGGKMSVRSQIGMAVPPEGAKIIFKSILESFALSGVEPNA